MAEVLQLYSKSSDCVYLVRGRENGRRIWYYVSVDRLKLPLFLKALKNGVVNLNLYGSILHSDWGYNPPDNIRQEMEEKLCA